MLKTPKHQVKITVWKQL